MRHALDWPPICAPAEPRITMMVPVVTPMPLLTTSDIAKDLKISEAGVRYLVRIGDLSIYALTRGGTRLCRPEDVEEMQRRRLARGKTRRRGIVRCHTL